VRRQAATTLQTMEAIVRVQAVFRGRRVRMSKDGRAVRSRISKRRRLSSRVGAQYGVLLLCSTSRLALPMNTSSSHALTIGNESVIIYI
jgi:hypothetical protein